MGTACPAHNFQWAVDDLDRLLGLVENFNHIGKETFSSALRPRTSTPKKSLTNSMNDSGFECVKGEISI